MTNITRRAALSGIATLSAAASVIASQGAATVPPIDEPLLRVIAAYEAGLRAYSAFPEDIGVTAEMQAAEETYGPPFDRLTEWKEPASTRAEAIGALRLALREAESELDRGFIIPMIAAALGYLEAQS